MMTNDPFQNYQAYGAYTGLPYTAFQPFATPVAIAGQPQQVNPGISGYGGYAQPFQGAGLQGAGIPGQPGYGQPFQQSFQTQNPLLQIALQQNPWLQNALLQNQILQNQILQNQLSQNPLLQHPSAQGPWQNPLLAVGPQNQLLNPALAYHGLPQQQQQFSYPLAPQSLIGAGGIGQQFGQINPLAHAALRQAAAYGYPPVAGYF
jgi:hypothetical protein